MSFANRKVAPAQSRVEHDAGADRRQRQPRLSVSLARSAADVSDAQRLRFKVFAEELGARIETDDGHDADEFDALCEHLIVRDEDTLRVVGTYRILPPHRARLAGRLYSDNEFDLTRLANLRPLMIEVGRSCVHRDYRSGATILLLWAGLAQYMKAHGFRHLIGCASASLADGGMQAARVRDELQSHLSDAEYRVFPRLPFPHRRIRRAASFELPPLIKGYLRLGGFVGDGAVLDPQFNTTDVCVVVKTDQVTEKYYRHYERKAAARE